MYGQVEGTGHNTVARRRTWWTDGLYTMEGMRRMNWFLGQNRGICRDDPLYFNGRHMMCSGPSMWGEISPLTPPPYHGAGTGGKGNILGRGKSPLSTVWVLDKSRKGTTAGGPGTGSVGLPG